MCKGIRKGRLPAGEGICTRTAELHGAGAPAEAEREAPPHVTRAKMAAPTAAPGGSGSGCAEAAVRAAASPTEGQVGLGRCGALRGDPTIRVGLRGREPCAWHRCVCVLL